MLWIKARVRINVMVMVRECLGFQLRLGVRVGVGNGLG